MKKFVLLVASFALALGGLVAFSGTSPSSAAPRCPYTGCRDTTTTVSAPESVRRGSSVRICVRVTTNGSGRPKGQVTVRVDRRAGGYSFADTARYNGGRVCFTTTRLNRPGKYVVTATFSPKRGSVFNGSSDATSIKVRR